MHFRSAQSIADKVLAHPQIEVHFHTEVVNVSGTTTLTQMQLINNQTSERTTITHPDGFGLFIFVGSAPATELVKDQVVLDTMGYVLTDANMHTAIDGFYVAGDIRHKELRQIVTAVSDGAIAAIEAEKYVATEKDRLGILDHPQATATSIPPASHPSTDPHASFLSAHIDHKFITEAIANQLLPIFNKLTSTMTLVSIVDASNPKSLELDAFLSEMTSLTDQVTLLSLPQGTNPSLEAHVHADKFPIVAFLDAQGNYTGVKFHGVPGGHELNSFVLAIYNLAGPGQPLSDTDREAIQKIHKPTHIQIAVSLSCHLCPDVVAAAQRIALLNPAVEAEMLDIALFPALREQHHLLSVPALIVDHEKVYFGAKKMGEIISLLDDYPKIVNI